MEKEKREQRQDVQGVASSLRLEDIQEEVRQEVTKMFDKTLDYCEVVVPDTRQYKKLRAKILRVGNTCIRNLQGYFEGEIDG